MLARTILDTSYCECGEESEKYLWYVNDNTLAKRIRGYLLVQLRRDSHQFQSI